MSRKKAYEENTCVDQPEDTFISQVFEGVNPDVHSGGKPTGVNDFNYLTDKAEDDTSSNHIAEQH